MIAYKFLAAGRVAPFTRHVWPEPGGWLEATRHNGDVAVCLYGVHACTSRHLPLWLDDELWEVELDGRIATSPSKVAAERGRLRRRIGAWNAGTSGDFALACALRARDHALWALRRGGAAEIGAAHSLSTAFRAREILAVATSTQAVAADERMRLPLGLTADAAQAAVDGACAAAAYVAAHAAGVVRGDAGKRVERAWQADWLAERLELPATS